MRVVDYFLLFLLDAHLSYISSPFETTTKTDAIILNSPTKKFQLIAASIHASPNAIKSICGLPVKESLIVIALIGF
jgi:hypothetical protein